MVAPQNLARVVVLTAASACLARPGAGEPPSFWGGRIRLGGELSGTIGSEDEGYFNYGNYDTSTLRLFRIDLATEVRVAPAVALVGELRSDNLDQVRIYAAYLRVRPWAERAFDVQAGLVPHVFGAFPRRRYGYDNPLPSLPLAYQYLTSLRQDAVPASAEQLLAQRGRGWRVAYPVGSSEPGPGVPLVNAERWDAGVQLRVGQEPLSLSLAVTQGTLSHPAVPDHNDGVQVSGRLSVRRGPALAVGLSGAVGDFLSREVTDALPPGARGGFRQTAAGVDLEYARGYWILRAEAVWSRWEVPALEPTLIEEPLDALGVYAEARYKLRPGLFLAGRLERLGFSAIDSSAGRASWEAPVTRLEAGVGFSPWRRVVVKASWQHNRRDGGRVGQNDLVAGQVLLWF